MAVVFTLEIKRMGNRRGKRRLPISLSYAA